MYSWGDDTQDWKKSGGYDFGSAKAPYLKKLKEEAEEKGPRSYSVKKQPLLSLVDPKGKTITSDSPNPIIVAVDGTASMQHWPAEIFDRLPLLYQTTSKWRSDVDVSFSVIGDAKFDTWPIQVADFGKGPALDDVLNALKPEGGGGPGIRESYELWAYFMLKHSKTPKAERPFLIVMGDEMFYDTVTADQVKKHFGDAGETADAKTVWRELAKKYNVFLLRKEYPGYDDKVKAQWESVLEPQHILPVYDATRCVDLAMGLIAHEWGQSSDFLKSLSARQDSKTVETVLSTLKTAPGLEGKVTSTGKSKKLADE